MIATYTDIAIHRSQEPPQEHFSLQDVDKKLLDMVSHTHGLISLCMPNWLFVNATHFSSSTFVALVTTGMLGSLMSYGSCIPCGSSSGGGGGGDDGLPLAANPA